MNVAVHRKAVAPACMHVVERYNGEIEDYNGSCSILYTAEDLSKNEYYYLKYRLLRRRVELLHAYWDDDGLNSFVVYLNRREGSGWHGGRLPYGFMRRGGVVVENEAKMALARKIIELHDAGVPYRMIRDQIDGCPSVSTMYVICKNRERYGV